MRRPEIIYAERAVAGLKTTDDVFKNLADAKVVWIDRYAQLFHRQTQSFRLQKAEPALILAESPGPFLYQATQRIREPGVSSVYYTDQWRNCLYDCDYCFLQGMHSSAYPMIFLNEEEYHEAALRQAAHAPVTVNTSFLTDALSFEWIVPTVAGWVDLAAAHPEIEIEVRTKSDFIEPFLSRAPVANVHVVWTLSPHPVSSRYERGCASLDARLSALAEIARAGWRPSIAIDPVILIPEWQSHYEELITRISLAVEPQQISRVSYGVFRMASAYLKRIREGRADSPILYHPFHRAGGLATYSTKEIRAVNEVVGGGLEAVFGAQRVAFVHG